MRCWMMLVLAVAGIGWGAEASRSDVTVAAAISLKPALEKAQPALEEAAGEKISFNFGASGALARQIEQGQGVDLFLSADRATVEKLVEAKAGEAGTQKAFAGNELVLIWTRLASDARHKPTGFGDLMKVGKLALGDPQVVPAGSYARETLTTLKEYDALQKAGKLVTAENVAQVLTYVQHGDAEAGIVYATDAKAAGVRVEVVATAEAGTHGPIEYVGVLVTGSKHRSAAAKAQAALEGEKVQEILREYGFTPPPALATRKGP